VCNVEHSHRMSVRLCVSAALHDSIRSVRVHEDFLPLKTLRWRSPHTEFRHA
jgi:hypothetical protein